MSLTLTYSGDLSRVQITITDLPDVDTVTVERSDNGLYWETVRGGGALPVVAGAASLDDYEFTADAENQYRVVSDAAPAGLYLPGEPGSYASTDDHASLDITGDLHIDADITPDAWPMAADATLVGKYNDDTDDRSYRFDLNANETASFTFSTDGLSPTGNQSVVLPVAEGDRFTIATQFDVDDGAGGHDTAYLLDAALLGTNPVAGVVSMFNGDAGLEVGARALGTRDPFAGVIHAARVHDGIDGALVADPDFAAQPTDTTSFTDSTGRAWTVHGNARIIGDPIYTGSITPSLDGQIWVKNLKYPFLNRPIEVVGWSDVTRASGTALYRVSGRSTPVAASDQRGSPTFELEVLTTTAEASRDLDLSLVSGHTFLVHLPAGCPVPGGYVSIGDNGIGRRANRTDRRRHRLPCTIVAPPGPGVVGSTMTWRTVFRLYGSWQALLNDNPTWRDLLATVGSEDDVVVI